MDLKQKLLLCLPSRERPLRTLWRVEKGGTINHLAGTAHFFPYRFRRATEALLHRGRRVFFEGPLDPDSMNRVVLLGSRGEGSSTIYDALDEATIRQIKEKTGNRFKEADRDLLPMDPFLSQEEDLLCQHFRSLRPWMAFLNLWTDYLRGRGWKYSVDLDAWEIAGRMGKEIRYLETIDEQVAAMERIPPERIIDFLKRVSSWDEYARSHRRAYLEGRIGEIMAQGRPFPSRCAAIIEERDPVMFDRLAPSFREGGTIAFVGSAHIIGLTERFEADGYRVEQVAEAKG